jgi:hypothetical protein
LVSAFIFNKKGHPTKSPPVIPAGKVYIWVIGTMPTFVMTPLEDRAGK